MKYLAKKKYVHRDLAARNVFVNETLVCKVRNMSMPSFNMPYRNLEVVIEDTEKNSCFLILTTPYHIFHSHTSWAVLCAVLNVQSYMYVSIDKYFYGLCPIMCYSVRVFFIYWLLSAIPLDQGVAHVQ